MIIRPCLVKRISSSKRLKVVRFDGLICVTQASGNLSLLRDLRQAQEFTSIPGKTIFPGLVAMSGMWNKSHENAICIRDPLCRGDNVMAWIRFPYYCPFVRGIHRWPVDSPHKGTVMWTFDVLLLVWISCLTDSEVASDLNTMILVQYHCNGQQ